MSQILNGIGVGQTLNHVSLLPVEVTDQFLHFIGKTMELGTTQIFEYQLPLPDGPRAFEAWLVTRNPNEVLAIIRDVTDRRAREAALESERSRIARELHDSLGQNLGYLCLKLDNLATGDNIAGVETTGRELAQMRDVANESYELVRHMIAAARSTNSDDLAGVVLAQAKLVGHRASFEVGLTMEGRSRALSPIVQQQLLYIIQEALSNVEKHAQAQQVDIKLVWSKAMLSISIADDGHGFDTNMPRPDGHYGLTIMQERAEEIQGLLTISSDPGTGTALTLQLPVAPIT
jgi:two-component system nitrate/nitrite sensor histidine kinase NarX